MEQARKKVKRLREEGATDPAILTELLQYCGVPFSNNGFYFLRESVIYLLNIPPLERRNVRITQEVYLHVAETFNSTPSRVERCIRSAIEFMCLNGDLNFISDLLGSSLNARSGKLPNKEMIYVLVEVMQQ